MQRTDTYNPTSTIIHTVRNPANTKSSSIPSAKASISTIISWTKNSVATTDEKVTYGPTKVSTIPNLSNSSDTSATTEAVHTTALTNFTKGTSNSTGFPTFPSGKVSRIVTSTGKTETSTLLTASSGQKTSSTTNPYISSKNITKLHQTNGSTGLHVSNYSSTSKPSFTTTGESTVLPHTQTANQNNTLQPSTLTSITPSETKEYFGVTTAVFKLPEGSETDVSTETTTLSSSLDTSSTSKVRSVKTSISISNNETNTSPATINAKITPSADTLVAFTTSLDTLSTDTNNISSNNISTTLYITSGSEPHVTNEAKDSTASTNISRFLSDVQFTVSTPLSIVSKGNFTGNSSHNASTPEKDLKTGTSGFFGENVPFVVIFTAAACLCILISGIIFYKMKAYQKGTQPDMFGSVSYSFYYIGEDNLYLCVCFFLQIQKKRKKKTEIKE